MTKAADACLKKLRAICLSLPETRETITWGEPHFRVRDKIFAGFGVKDGVMTTGCKLTMDHAASMIQIPGFSKAPYVGHKGWVSIDLGVVKDWDLIEELLQESYKLIAPKKLVALLEETESVDGVVPARVQRRSAARKK